MSKSWHEIYKERGHSYGPAPDPTTTSRGESPDERRSRLEDATRRDERGQYISPHEQALADLHAEAARLREQKAVATPVSFSAIAKALAKALAKKAAKEAAEKAAKKAAKEAAEKAAKETAEKAAKEAAEKAAKAAAAQATKEAAELEVRAKEIHGLLNDIAQRKRTTAIVSTSKGRIVGSGGEDLTPAQRAALKPGEIVSKSPKDHAEVTVLKEALRSDAKPKAIGVSRPICKDCQAVIQSSGGTLTSPTTAIWP